VIRLRSMESSGVLHFPIIAVNDAETKHFFDNRYGTGQSTIDGIIRATNPIDGGGNVCRFRIWVVWKRIGDEGKRDGGQRHRHGGEPLRALEAVMDGYRVMPMAEAAEVGDIFCTVTGNVNVIRREHFLK